MVDKLLARQRARFIRRLLEKQEKINQQDFKQLLSELAEERDLYAAVLEGLVGGVLVFTTDFVLRYYNPTAATILNLPLVVEKPLSLDDDRFPEPMVNAVRECCSQQLRTMDEELPIDQGIPRLLTFSCVPMPESTLAGALILVQDITDRHMAQLSFNRQQKLASLTHLAAGLAHEISNPLNSLSIYTDLLRRELKDTPSLEKIKIVREEINRLNETLQNFLKAVRPSLPQFDEHALEPLLTKTLQVLEPECTAAGVAVEYTPIPPSLHIMADQEQLRGAILNLCRNAIQAMPNGGTLSVQVYCHEGWIQIEFSDDGVGITPEELPRLFEPYYTTRPDGTGLGLAMVDRVVREHQGSVHVTSEPGKGSCFTIRLPLYVRPHHQIAHDESPSSFNKDY